MSRGTIKVLHFADAHIGVSNYGTFNPKLMMNQRTADFVDSLAEIVDYATANRPHIVVFAGDAYHNRHPRPEYIRAFSEQIKRLADELIPVVIIKGNHDMPTTSSTSALDVFSALDTFHVTILETGNVASVHTRAGYVQVAALGWANAKGLLQLYDGDVEHKRDFVSDAERAVVGILDDMANAVDPSLPSILAAHANVEGAVFGSERSVMLGSDIIIPKWALDGPWNYVALGHIHKRQDLGRTEQGAPIVYPGSIARVDFGEEKERKGFAMAEIGPTRTDWQFIDVPDRPFVTAEADLTQSDDPQVALTEQLLPETSDYTYGIVRAIVRLREDQRRQVSEGDVVTLLHDAHYIASVRFDVERERRVRLTERPETLTDAELLERYLDMAAPDAPRENIMSIAKEVMT